MTVKAKAKKKATPKAKAAPRAALAEKEPTELHEGFAEYIKTETGYQDVDLKSVQLATVLRMDYQKSDENQARLTANKAARAEADAKREQARKDRETKAAAKAAKKTTAKKSTPAPAKKAAKKAPAKKAPARRKAAKPSDESFD